MNRKKIAIALLSLSVVFTGCTSSFMRPTGSTSYTTTGAVGGAAGGAALGQLIGGDTKSTLIGTAAGALLGTIIGSNLQQQENDLKMHLANSGVQIYNDGSTILLTIPEGLTFSIDSASLKSSFAPKLSAMTTVFNQYPDSRIVVTGYTDSTGTYDHNIRLSEQRAMSVANYFVGQGLDPNRLTVIGRGPDFPVASNSTAQGRAANRRVTIQVFPNQ